MIVSLCCHRCLLTSDLQKCRNCTSDNSLNWFEHVYQRLTRKKLPKINSSTWPKCDDICNASSARTCVDGALNTYWLIDWSTLPGKTYTKCVHGKQHCIINKWHHGQKTSSYMLHRSSLDVTTSPLTFLAHFRPRFTDMLPIHCRSILSDVVLMARPRPWDLWLWPGRSRPWPWGLSPWPWP